MDKKIKNNHFLLVGFFAFFSLPLAWSQQSFCKIALGLSTYFFQRSVSTLDSLNNLAKPIGEVWGRIGYDGRTATALIAKSKSYMSFGVNDVYRGMWVTPEELVKISKEGLKATDGNYGKKIHFSASPAEAIRYGAQGAEDKKGVLILMTANSKKGKIYPRDETEKGAEMVSVADDFVPANAITSMWVFDPDPKRSEEQPFRAVNLNAIRSLPNQNN